MSDLNTRDSKGVILLVDDTPSDVHPLSDFLTGKGFDVRFESSGRAAIQTAVNDPPEIILLDVKMPEMDGYEVCERLKAVEDLKSIPVLFIGVLDETMDKVKGFDVGGADYITKPFEFVEVLARVEAHLTNARMKIQLELATRELDAARRTSERLHANLEGQVQRRTAELEDANKALREIKTQFEAVYNHHYQLTGLIDKKGRLLMGNRTALEFAGVEAEDVIGKRFWETPWWTHSQEVQRMLREAMERAMRGEMVNFESTHISVAGETRNIDFRIGPVFDDDGEVIYLVPEGYDITDRKLAEMALSESEKKYRNFIENAPIAMYTIDIKGNFTYGNKKLLEMTGYKKEDWFNKPFHPIVHPEDLEFVINTIQDRIASNGTADPYEIRIFDSSGKIMWVKINSESIYETDEIGDKKLVGMQSFIEDVTDRKRAEEALRESEEFLETIVENIPDMIFVKDAKELRFVRFNKAGEELLGYSREELIGKNDYDFFSKEEADFFTKKDRDVLSSGGHLDIPEEPIQTRYKGKRILHTKKLPIMDEEGKSRYLLGISEDITEHKRAEKNRINLEAQLQQAHKMESIGTLAGGIAHDFNNILGIILGNTELSMYDVPEWNPARLNLEEIRTASLRAKDVVQQLLSFARKTKLEKKPTNIIPIIKESLKLLRSSIPTSIEIRQNIPEDIDTILADPTQINQVLINLCTNADHAMPDGGIIEVSLKNVELDEDIAAKYPELNPGRYVNLVIKDTGHGIAQDDIDRIFDPYFTTKEVGKGTGMGLAVVHGIVQGHNGIIVVESELGKETTLSIFFPVVAKEAVEETEPDEKLPTGDERILFVDDEELIVGIGHQILERLGYKVESTTSPIDALELFRSKPDQFDLLITDLTMPKMTGDKLAKEILKIQPDILIILCTGFSEKIDEKKSKAIGVADYIEKPLDMRDYAMKVRKVLDVE